MSNTTDPDTGTDDDADASTDGGTAAHAGGFDLHDDVALTPIDDIYPYANNPKEHPDEQVDKIASSIKNFGWDQPVVVDAAGEIIKGHGRYQAAKQLDLDHVPVIHQRDLTESEVRAARLADNRTAESPWDDELLSSELDVLDDADYDLDVTGFDDDELADLIDGGDPGDVAGQDYEPGSLTRDFGVPPFSVLDTRQGYWQERRDDWYDLDLGGVAARDHAAAYGDQDQLNSIADGIELETGVSRFDPVLAELLYRWFSPQPHANGTSEPATILDPFAGGPVRAAVAALLGRHYIGIDINPTQVQDNRDYWRTLSAGLRESAPPSELPADLDTTPDDTPVENHGDYWFKREDKYLRAGVNGAKIRAFFALADEHDAQGIIDASSRVSPNHVRVAAVAKRLGIPARLHTSHGDYTEEMEIAESLGAEIVQHEPGYLSQCKKAADEDVLDRDGWLRTPFAAADDLTRPLTVEQVATLADHTDDVDRVVVPIGSGFTLASVLAGLDRHDIDLPVLGVAVGGDYEDTLDQYAPADWRSKRDAGDLEIVESDLAYEDHAPKSTLAGVPLDPVYEAKAIPYMEPGDLLWIVSTRATALPDDDPRAGIVTGDHPAVPTDDTQQDPTWIAGDSADMATLLPDADTAGPNPWDSTDDPAQADMLFSCPPYHDLEEYTDDPADLSNMDYDDFLATYQEIIAAGLDHLKPNRFAAFVVGDIRDDAGGQRAFPEATVDAFTQRDDVHLYNHAILVNAVGTLAVRARNQFTAGRKLGRQHQHILVFWKDGGDGSGPDNDTIRDAMGGDATFGDPEEHTDTDDADDDADDADDSEAGA